MSENAVLKQQKAGFYRDVELLPKQPERSPIQDKFERIRRC
jgi:hypothetical protein